MYNYIGDKMKYDNITTGVFKKRLNRFVCTVEIDGKPYEAHLKNTGRLKELLFEGNTVYLQKSSKRNRRQRCYCKYRFPVRK